MSADNWTTCPKCKQRVEAEYTKARSDLDALYGLVSLEEYEKLKSRLPQRPPEPEHTLREDYSIGIHEGEFVVDYYASCKDDACDFEFRFEHSVVPGVK